jgi:cytochrome P450
MASDEQRRPPGPRGYPLLGHSYQMFREPLAFGKRCAREYGDIVSLRVAGSDAVQLSHPDYVQHALEDNFENYRKGEFYRTELSLLGEGLLVSEGDLWAQQREIIGPMFHPERIEQYTQSMVDYAERARGDLEGTATVAIDEVMQQLTLEILADALFNIDIREETAGISAAVNDVMNEARLSSRIPIDLPSWVPTPGNRRYNRAVETFDSVVFSIIERHREQTNPPDDVVSKLLAATDDNGDPLTDEQIRDEVLTLLLAGHDTTALALGYVWYLLCTAPEKQTRLVAEIDSVVGDRSLSLGDIPKLTYTKQVIKEALRLYPPVYLFAREAKAADTIGGYEIDAETLLFFNQWIVHRDPRFFDTPDEFEPERWTDAFETQLHPYAYYPFSGGPRRCIGERFAMIEMQIILATFFQQFRFDLGFEAPLELDPKVSLRPARPVTVRPQPR